MTQAVSPLADVRVLDLGNYITAPYAGMLLAEMGADVIKIERPGAPDPFRSHTEHANSPFFLAFNRNKRAVALDYTKPEGLAVLKQLIARADVLLINVRPGVEAKMGLAPDAVRAEFPRLIYALVTGYGATGPYAGRPAFDGVGQALTGLLSRFHRSDDPRIPGPAILDSLTGLFACIGVLGALHERDRTGAGRLVEVNMIEAALAFQVEPLAHYFVLGEDQPFHFRGASSQTYILSCRDGKRIGLHMSSPEKFWQGLSNAIGRPDLLARYPTREARMEHYEAIGRELAEIFATRERAEWIPLLEVNDVPFAPERLLSELEHDEQVRHLGTFNTTDDPVHGRVRGINRAVRFDGDNHSGFRPPPDVGEHTDEVLRELGFAPNKLADLRARGILGDNGAKP